MDGDLLIDGGVAELTFNNILIVDDHEEIILLMTDFLEIENYQVYSAKNTNEASDILHQTKIDCILLNVMMPGMDGFSFCKNIRKESDIPILFLSAYETDTDKIRGLTLGADDYIVKSASPSEIVARIKAVERRMSLTRDRGSGEKKILSIGNLILNKNTRSVTVGTQEVDLTAIEFNLLEYFMENEGIVLSYEQIIARIWHDEFTGYHSVRVHVANLREKLAVFSSIPEIKTIRSVGYLLQKG